MHVAVASAVLFALLHFYVFQENAKIVMNFLQHVRMEYNHGPFF